jgi:Spy/CpxP family protein refolding chaperone
VPAESLPRTVRLTTALVLVATFAVGTVTGVGLCRWLTHREPPGHGPHGWGPIPLDELGLSEEQRQKAHAVFERHRPELYAILRETYPKANAVREKVEREVRELLTPEQRRRLDELESRRPPRPPGPPGPPPFGPPPGPPPPGASTPGANGLP